MGVLLNVDYSDELTRLRVRSIVRQLQRAGMFSRLASLPDDVIADAFYVHYRTPILREQPGRDETLWYMFVKTYLSSDVYQEVSKISRYNYRVSKIAATKLLRAYSNFLWRAERGSGAANGEERGARNAGDRAQQEIEMLIRFYMGSIKDVERLRRSIARALGEEAGKTAAELLFSIDADPYRARLAKILESVVEVLSVLGPELRHGEVEERQGLVTGITRIKAFSDLRRATNLTRALYISARELFSYKLATKSLSVYELSVDTRGNLYLLVDKSGSMFYTVYDEVARGATQKIAWATALAIALMRKGSRVVLRFFDQIVHPPVTSVKEAIRSLLSVMPLGGTDITAAVHTAVSDAKRSGLYKYKLVLITDGEDDAVRPEILRAARQAFREVRAVLVGGTNKVIESCLPTLKVNPADFSTLKAALRSV
ncbi:MAG: hypothetical protein LM577_01560 [Thermoproteaceae archaeon]|nr:hypothetical protein [Thermoproteaceae archaeon]